MILKRAETQHAELVEFDKSYLFVQALPDNAAKPWFSDNFLRNFQFFLYIHWKKNDRYARHFYKNTFCVSDVGK